VTNVLTVSHLTCAYDDKTILNDLSFSLERGLHVLLGQNGSGKTTLFRALLGIVPPRSGTVTLNGENLLNLSPKMRARRVSAVLGSHQTLHGITGQALAELALYAKSDLFSHPTQTDRQTIRDLAQQMGALSLLSVPLENMSAGERQLTALLAAAVQNTPLMLLDEPTSALDYNRTHDFMHRAKESAADKILLCTLHDPALALKYADTILLLKDGGVAAAFSPHETTAEKAQELLRQIYPAIRIFSTENGLSAE